MEFIPKVTTKKIKHKEDGEFKLVISINEVVA
jgi:hypothetical protein